MRSRHLTVAIALATAFAAPAALAPPALAGCGGVETSRPTKKLGAFRAPLIVGDSVLLGAIPQVAHEGYEVNTHGCRQWTEGDAVVRAHKHAGVLPHEVVMFLGADWTVSRAQIAETLHLIGSQRVLGLVTPREVGGGGSSDAEHMRRAAKAHPTRIVLLDWVRYTRHRNRWFAPDGLHLGIGGAQGLAHFLRRALPYAAPGTFPGPKPAPTPTTGPATPAPPPDSSQPPPPSSR
jgi:hypothetical protein